MGMEAPLRKPYPSDVSDDEWAFIAPYLTLMTEDAPQRHHELRELFNGLRYVVKTGAPWRWMPNDLAPWEAVYQQSQRWLRAGCFEAIVHDLRALLRLAAGRPPEPTAARFRRLARDYERLPETLAGLHFVAFACLMLTRLFLVLGPLQVHNSL